jgi:hypothetical protein
VSGRGEAPRGPRGEPARGNGWTTWHNSGYLSPVSYILIRGHVYASIPEAGAQYGNPVHWDLCGGCRVTGIPTATTLRTKKADTHEEVQSLA